MLLLHVKHHWPDHVTTMMWLFALKEAAYWSNWLSLQSGCCSCEATFFGVDKDSIDPSINHTFGLPCFVLDSCLQSGVGSAPKWEPRSCLGIYVVHSPSHAGLVALVLNPWIGHVSPQFHVVFDDLFTTVPFMEKNEVPPHWAQSIKKSHEKVTEEHYELAKTWLFSDSKPGNISLPEQNQNVSNNSNGTLIDQEMIGHNVSQNLLSTGMQPSIHAGLSGYSDVPGISQLEDFIQCPLLLPVSSSCNGEMTL
jgi:hypothetical protein